MSPGLEPQELEDPAAVLSDKAPLNQSSWESSLSLRPKAHSWHAWLLVSAALATLLLTLSRRPPDGGAPPRVGPAASLGPIPTHPLAGGGSIPMMMMGGDDFGEWFKAVGKGAGIQNFYSYHNGPHIAPQLARFGRENVFVSSGIPCGCCGYDAPKIQPMNATLAAGYIDATLAQLNTSYVDLLLFHHRCRTEEETARVWEALEAAKRSGKARHLGVSNFVSPPRVEPLQQPLQHRYSSRYNTVTAAVTAPLQQPLQQRYSSRWNTVTEAVTAAAANRTGGGSALRKCAGARGPGVAAPLDPSRDAEPGSVPLCRDGSVP